MRPGGGADLHRLLPRPKISPSHSNRSTNCFHLPQSSLRWRRQPNLLKCTLHGLIMSAAAAAVELVLKRDDLSDTFDESVRV